MFGAITAICLLIPADLEFLAAICAFGATIAFTIVGLSGCRLRYKEPKEKVSKLITASAADEGKSAYDASPDMQFATAIAEFGMLLRNSPHKGTASWDDVMQLARIARGEDLEGVREEFLRMIDSAKAVTGPRVAAQ